MVTSTSSALEQAGLLTGSRDEAQPGTRQVTLTARGEQKVLEALPMANSLADDLYQGLSDDDLVHVLSLLPKLCGSAWQVGQHYGAARKPGRLTSTTPAQ
jgi:DNA-binding MarR family transcriptional regulator